MDINSLGMIQYQQGDVTESQNRALRGGNDSQLKDACREFEALFIKQMLDAMRKTVTKSKMIDGGQAEEIFEDMLYTEYADTMSRTASLGISDMLYSQLKPGGSGLVS